MLLRLKAGDSPHRLYLVDGRAGLSCHRSPCAPTHAAASPGQLGWGSPASPQQLTANPATACPAWWVTGTRDMGQAAPRRVPPALAVAIETEAGFCAAMPAVSEQYPRCRLFLSVTFSNGGSQERGMRDAAWCRAACLAGRAGHSLGKALLGLSWCLLCSDPCSPLGGLSPNPPSSEHARTGAPLLWALQCWGSEGVLRRKAPRRNLVWERALSCKPQLTVVSHCSSPLPSLLPCFATTCWDETDSADDTHRQVLQATLS